MRRMGAAGLVMALCAGGCATASGGDRGDAEVRAVLDAWHLAAAAADETAYFGAMAPGFVFLGTDMTERWDVKSFRDYAHPHFAKGKGWRFRATRRDVVVGDTGTVAWFDEDLATEKLGPARGSGVLVHDEAGWRLAQYVLSTTVPNDRFDAVKRAIDGAGSAAPVGAAVTIGLAHDAVDERATREQLERLLKAYDVSPWLLARAVQIDNTAIPHSHPVLTLHTRHLLQDDELLSTFIHEQLHWWLEANAEATAAAVTELRALFPGLPVGYPEGASTELSSYEHLIVIWLEWHGVRRLLGEERAAQVMAFWTTSHYRALYRLVLKEEARIGAVVERLGLAFPPKAQ